MTALIVALMTMTFSLTAHAQQAPSQGGQGKAIQKSAFVEAIRGAMDGQSCDASEGTTMREVMKDLWTQLDTNGDDQLGRREIAQLRQEGGVEVSGYVFSITSQDDGGGANGSDGAAAAGDGRWTIELNYDDYNVVLLIQCSR